MFYHLRALVFVALMASCSYGFGLAMAETLHLFAGNVYVDKTWVNCEGFGKPLFDGFGIDTRCRY